MDDPDQTAPVPQDDGKVPPTKPTARERDELATGNRRADPPKVVVRKSGPADRKRGR